MSARVPEPQLAAWRAVLNVHASVVSRIERALAEAGLPPLAWYDVLWALRRAPDRRVRMSGLAEHLTLSRGGLTKLAGRLAAAGLIRREPADEDRRGSYAVLTDEGERMLRRMWPVYAAELAATFGTLDADQALAVAEALGRASAAAAG